MVSFGAIAFLVALYFLGYALAGHRVSGYRDKQAGTIFCGFSYPDTWEAKLFVPAAAIESFVCNRNVVTGTRYELTWESPVRE